MNKIMQRIIDGGPVLAGDRIINPLGEHPQAVVWNEFRRELIRLVKLEDDVRVMALRWSEKGVPVGAEYDLTALVSGDREDM